MSERSPGEGRYARLEREQRWLLAAVPEQARYNSEILDQYLQGTRLRLRRVTLLDRVICKLGQKVRLVDGDPERVKLTNICLSAEEYDTFATLSGAELPPFALSDVTHDDRYSGGALAHASDQELETLLGETPGHASR